jgi:hypothetical protein
MRAWWFLLFAAACSRPKADVNDAAPPATSALPVATPTAAAPAGPVDSMALCKRLEKVAHKCAHVKSPANGVEVTGFEVRKTLAKGVVYVIDADEQFREEVELLQEEYADAAEKPWCFVHPPKRALTCIMGASVAADREEIRAQIER